MLLSLLKILVFLALVAALAMGITYLLDAENIVLGDVQTTIAGTEYTISPLQTVILILILSGVVLLVLKLSTLLVAILRFINGDETAVSRYFFRNRERKGYQAFSEGMLALASGEGGVALSKATKAERYLKKPALTNLLAAQAAEISGDRQKATEIYKTLIMEQQTRFVGIRGILKQRLEDGETEVALKLAEKAFLIKPKHEETQDILLSLQARSQDWEGARKTLNAKLKHGGLPRDVHKRRDAVLALSQARGILKDGETIEAREAAIESNRLSPDLVPAAAMAARSYIEQDKHKYALRVIKKAWAAQPHPDLAAAFCEIAPDETPLERLKRFEMLRKLAPEHRETKLTLAELHLVAEDFPGARRALGTLLDHQPDAHILTIMAAIERGEGGEDHAVRAWLAKALSAQRGPQWVCENCQTAHPEWDPVCPICDAFDTMSWKEPPATTLSSSTHFEMLPLLVGKSANGEVSQPVDYIERGVQEDSDTKDPEPENPKT